MDENSQFSVSEPETNYQFLNEIDRAKSLESQSDQFARRSSMLSEEDLKYRAYVAQQAALPKIDEEEETGTPGLKRNVSFNPSAFKSPEKETLETEDQQAVQVIDLSPIQSPQS